MKANVLTYLLIGILGLLMTYASLQVQRRSPTWSLTTPNGQGRLREMEAMRGTVMNTLLAFQYETGWDSGTPGYDAVGNVENIMERRWSTTTTHIDQRQEFFYDDLDRLSSAQVFNTGGGGSGTGILAQEEYTYDQIGNLVTRYVNDLQPDPETAYGYSTPDMTGCPGTAEDSPKAHAVYSTTGRMTNTYCYDAVGNMVHRQMVSTDTVSQTLVYDAENRLKYLYNDPNSLYALAGFQYDGDGNRVRATMGGVTTLYVGGHVEYRIEASLPNTETLVTYYMGGSQKIAMREQVVGESETLYFLLSDHLGSTSTTLDEDGYKIADLRYTAWGTRRWGDGETPTRRRYTGQIEDVETGLYFYNARYYDPVLAWFIQADNLVPEPRNPQTFNRYAYVKNNPLRYSDPTGHRCLDEVDNTNCKILGRLTNLFAPLFLSAELQGVLGAEGIAYLASQTDQWWGSKMSAQEAVALVLIQELHSLAEEFGKVPEEAIEAATRLFNEHCSGGAWTNSCFNGFWNYFEPIRNAQGNFEKIIHPGLNPMTYADGYFWDLAGQVIGSPEVGGDSWRCTIGVGHDIPWENLLQ